MAFKVEDGTGLTDSNSYATYAELQAYTTLRGISISGHTQPEWETYLVRATDYIDSRWVESLKGERLLETQALAFPRSSLYDLNGTLVEGIPTKLKNATIEYAFKVAAGELFITPTVDSTGQRIKSIRRVVGPIEKTVSYAGDAPNPVRIFPVADGLMRDYIVRQGRVIRA